MQGDSSHDELIYSALTRLATSHTLPPRTLAATYEALADVEDVTTDYVRVQGRPAVEVTFAAERYDGGETLVVDSATDRRSRCASTTRTATSPG